MDIFLRKDGRFLQQFAQTIFERVIALFNLENVFHEKVSMCFLYFRREFFKTSHPGILPYDDMHIVTAVLPDHF